MVFLRDKSAGIKSQPKRIGITLTIFIATMPKLGRGNPASGVAAAPLRGQTLEGEISHRFGYQCGWSVTVHSATSFTKIFLLGT